MKSIIILSTCLFSVSNYAHSGGTDVFGCHYDTTNGSYHCHNPKMPYLKNSVKKDMTLLNKKTDKK